MTKGQVGIETLLIVGILFIILIASVAIYLNRSTSIANIEVYLSAKRICNELQTSVNEAASSYLGFRSTMNITSKLLGKSYNITVDGDNREILINWTTAALSCPLSFQNVTNGTSSFFKILPGKIAIQNINGVVVIAQL